jgi:ABC-type Fe3+-hydroxamate transport system substrate-binding protein
MVDFNLGGVLSVINNAIAAVQTADRYIDEMRDSGVVLNSTSQEEVDAKIAELEKSYDALRDRVQSKLRGTGG